MSESKKKPFTTTEGIKEAEMFGNIFRNEFLRMAKESGLPMGVCLAFTKVSLAHLEASIVTLNYMRDADKADDDDEYDDDNVLSDKSFLDAISKK